MSALQFVKNLNKTENEIGRGGMYGATAAILSTGKSYFPEEKSFPYRFHERNPQASSEICRGVAAGGTVPPSARLSKSLFDSLKRHVGAENYCGWTMVSNALYTFPESPSALARIGSTAITRKTETANLIVFPRNAASAY